MTLNFWQKSIVKYRLLVFTGLVFLVLGSAFVPNLLNNKNTFSSRAEFEKAIEVVKNEKPTPPVAAIFYAKVAKDIYDGKTTENLIEVLNQIKEEEKKLPEVKLMQGNSYNEYWVKGDLKNPDIPFSPKISQYDRFLLKDFTYQVPPPPKYKSPEFYARLKEVKEAASNRTGEQGALVNFYGGVPGTEGPAGIWQNILWAEVQKENNKFINKYLGNIFTKRMTDKEYAKIQMILAESLADSFMECWKVKYIYQTKRPDMTDKTLGPVLAMPNPPFPSYTSGHSTISFTAANILTHFIPNKKDTWLKHAAQARDSRLHAGIHFSYDNSEGQKLGEEVAKNIIFNLEKTQ